LKSYINFVFLCGAVEGWNFPKVFSKTLTTFQTFGTAASTEMKHTDKDPILTPNAGYSICIFTSNVFASSTPFSQER